MRLTQSDNHEYKVGAARGLSVFASADVLITIAFNKELA